MYSGITHHRAEHPVPRSDLRHFKRDKPVKRGKFPENSRDVLRLRQYRGWVVSCTETKKTETEQTSSRRERERARKKKKQRDAEPRRVASRSELSWTELASCINGEGRAACRASTTTPTTTPRHDDDERRRPRWPKFTFWSLYSCKLSWSAIGWRQSDP